MHDIAGVVDLLGFADGLVGALLDGLDGTTDLAPIADRIPRGSTALMAEVEEYALEPLDAAMAHLGGTVYRESTDDVKAGLKAIRNAQREAEKQAEAREREAHKLERERERAQRHNERIGRVQEDTNRIETWLEGQKTPVPAAPGTSSPSANAG